MLTIEKSTQLLNIALNEYPLSLPYLIMSLKAFTVPL